MSSNIAFADEFHAALQTWPRRRSTTIRQYAKAIVDTGINSILRAQVVWSVNARLDIVPLDQLSTLANLASAASSLTEDSRRKQRDYLTLVGFWSRARLEHYGMQDCSSRVIRCWVKLAVKNLTWEASVGAVNLCLIARQESSLRDAKTNRIGVWRQQAKATRLVAELQDVMAACNDLSPTKKNELEALQEAWLEPCNCLLERIRSAGHNPRFYMVTLDQHGMLASHPVDEPSAVRICGSCVNSNGRSDRPSSDSGHPLAQNTGTNSKRLPASEDLNPALLEHDAAGLHLESSSATSTSPATLDRDSIFPSFHCQACGGECHLVCSPNSDPQASEIGHEIAYMHERLLSSGSLLWAQPKLCLAPTLSLVDADGCDGTYLCETGDKDFTSWAQDGKPCPDSVIIRAQTRPQTFDRREYAQLFRRRHAGMEFKVPTRHEEHHQTVATILDDFLDYLSGDRAPSESVSFIGLAGISSLPKPAFLHLERFKLLQTLLQRRSYAADRNDDPSGRKMRYDVKATLAYSQFSSRGVYDRAQVDFTAGMWLRVVFGVQLWWIVPPQAMNETDWKEFMAYGVSWDPGEKARAFFLNPGDVLYLGPKVIHGAVTIQDTAVDVGVVWDDRNIIGIVDALTDSLGTPAMTQRPLLSHLPEVVDELLNVLALYEPAADTRKEITEKLFQLQLSGCQCLTPCYNECPCYIFGGGCTLWCQSHQVNGGQNCMLDHAQSTEPYTLTSLRDRRE